MDMFTLRCYVHFCAACVLCRTSRGANTLAIEGTIPARHPAMSAKSSALRIQHPSSPITITCCLPSSPSPPARQHGFSLQRVTRMTSQDDVMPEPLVDVDPAVSDGAGDVSGLSGVTVSGSVSEGCLVLVLRRGECRDSGEYLCASDYGTTTKVLDMYPGEVAIATTYDGPWKQHRKVQCSVFATVEITWSWQNRHSADSPWTDVSTDDDHNFSDVIPDVIDRCDVAWSSVLSVSQWTSDRSWSFRCCAGYRDVSHVSCAMWSPAEPEHTSSSGSVTTVLTTHNDVNFSLTSSTMTTGTTDDGTVRAPQVHAGNATSRTPHYPESELTSSSSTVSTELTTPRDGNFSPTSSAMTTGTNNVNTTPVPVPRQAILQQVRPITERKSPRAATEIGAVVVVAVVVVVTAVGMVVFAVHRAVSGRGHLSISTPRGRLWMTTTLSQRPLVRHNTITPVDT